MEFEEHLSSWHNRDRYPERERALCAEIAEALPANLVYDAFGSLDGHHGIDRLSPISEEWRTGKSTSGLPVSRSKDRLRSLRRGRSNNGDQLLVFEGRIPSGRKKVYQIAFYEAAIRSGIENSRSETAQRGEDANAKDASE